MGRYDPHGVECFEAQKNLWLVEALERLPVAIGLIDADGRFIALNGTMRGIFGDVIPSRDAEQVKKWQVFDDHGNLLDPSQWPSERTLRGFHAMNGAVASICRTRISRGGCVCSRCLLLTRADSRRASC